MAQGFRPKRKGEFENWPLGHRIVMGGMLLLLFLEGMWIVYRFGAVHILVYLVLWILSFPVIHFFLCRKCYNCGKRCAIPGEGDLSHLLFQQQVGPPRLANWMGTALCYLMRTGYPAVFLFLYPERFPSLTGVILALTLGVFLFLDSRVIGCPYCMNKNCPLNPDCVN